MKRVWAFYFFIFSAIPLYAGPKNLKLFNLTDFSQGVNSNYSSLTIKDNEVQDCLNVYFSKDNSVVKRNGFTPWGSVSTGPILNSWQFTDTGGQAWFIIRTTTAIYASPGTGIFSSLIATVTASTGLVSEVNAQNKAVFVDRLDGVFTWDGSTTSYISGSPKGNVIVEFHGRVWVAGAANPNQSVLYGSKYLDVTVWTVSQLTVSDPVALSIGLNDNADGITTLFSGLNDVLYTFKNLSINGLYGFDQADFQSRIISRDVGCVDPQSLQPYKGNLNFLSRRGLESFDGVTSTRISKKIKDRIDPCIVNTIGNFATRSWTQTTSGDFANGFIDSGLSTSTIINSLTNTSTDYQQTTQGDFSSGSYAALGPINSSIQIRYYDYISNPGTLQTTFPDEFVSMRDGTLGTAFVWSNYNGGNEPVTVANGMARFYTDNVNSKQSTLRTSDPVSSVGFVENPLKGTTFYTKIDHVVSPSTGPFFEIALSSQLVLSPNAAPPTGNYFLVRMALGGQDKVTVDKIEYRNNSTSAITTISGSHNLWLQLPVDFYLYIDTGNFLVTVLSTNTPGSGTVSNTHTYSPGTGSGAGAGVYLVSGSTGGSGTVHESDIYIDRFGIAPQRIIYTSSPTFDTGTGAPIWDTFQTDVSTNGGAGTIAFFSEVSDTPGGPFDSFVTASSGSVIASSAKRYLAIKTLFTDNLSSYGISMNGFDAAGYSTGTFRSAVDNDVNISTWGSFLANKVDSGGTHSFFIRSATGAFTVSSTFPAWSPISPGAFPSIAPLAFFQIRDDFAQTGGRNAAMQLQDFTVQWNDGQIRPNVTSVVYDNRYWLACTTTTGGSGNDLTIIMSEGESEGASMIPIYSYFDINAGSFVIYQNNLYHGDSASNGNVYLDNQGYNDNGRAINAFIKTKDFELDGGIFDKQFQDVYVKADALGSYGINTSYNLDRSTNSYALDTISQDEQPGFVLIDLPFGQGDIRPVIGRTINFTFANRGLDQKLNLYGGILQYSLKGETRNLGK